MNDKSELIYLLIFSFFFKSRKTTLSSKYSLMKIFLENFIEITATRKKLWRYSLIILKKTLSHFGSLFFKINFYQFESSQIEIIYFWSLFKTHINQSISTKAILLSSKIISLYTPQNGWFSYKSSIFTLFLLHTRNSLFSIQKKEINVFIHLVLIRC